MSSQGLDEMTSVAPSNIEMPVFSWEPNRDLALSHRRPN